ncbi:MAG: hypothetical protein QXP19_05600 [Thermoproteota archaeon]
MPKKSLSQKISEAIELGEKFNKVLSGLPPEIRETIMKYSSRKTKVRRRRRRARATPKRKQKVPAAAT